MSRKYKFGDSGYLHFVSYAVVYWLDVFIRDEYRKIWIDSLRYCQQQKGLNVYGWCLMTSHAHLIISSETTSLANIIRDFKRYTSEQLHKAIRDNPQESRTEWLLWMCRRAGMKNSNNNNFQFWQQHNHPIQLMNHEIFMQKINYIHNNPVVAGFVERPEDWLYSSAYRFSENKGLIKLHYVD